MSKVIILGANPFSIINFRGDLIRLINKNHVVVVASNKPSKELAIFFKKNNWNYANVLIKNNGLNPLFDLISLIDIYMLFKKHDPDKILSYTIKPVIWSGLVSNFYKFEPYFLITGLGFAFQGESIKRRLLTKLIVFLYRMALKNSKAVIFQNIDNRDVFIDKGIIPKAKAHIVNGSGVDTEKFNVENLPRGDIKFLCISRLLGEKGLREYAEAAKIVKNKFPDAEFNLVGPEDSSPDAILLNEVDTWSDYIDYKGSTDDVRPYIKDSHVYVLPSYHEGLPRSTLEAMSMGRSVLTTNAVGCKETVKEGINGFKVPVKSSEMLAKKMIWFIKNSDQIEKMGIESRKMVEDKFDVHKVNKEMLKIMEIE
jgi:glycosyltransferase involved in cell wall biosynthesis